MVASGVVKRNPDFCFTTVEAKWCFPGFCGVFVVVGLVVFDPVVEGAGCSGGFPAFGDVGADAFEEFLGIL